MNVLLFLTDQQRAIQHFPPGWTQRNMPGADAPAGTRADVRERVHERVHVLARTLDADVRLLPRPARRQVHARDRHAGPRIPPGGARAQLQEPRDGASRRPATPPSTRESSTATSRRNGATWAPDVNKYGFTRWDPPDAGANQDVPEEGGGIYDNDGRFMNSQGTPEAGTEGALQYLTSTAAQSQPFFMVVSLVNPHDVLLYPKTYTDGAMTTRG